MYHIGNAFFFTYLFCETISFMGQPEEVVNLAKPYLDIVAFSLIPLIMFQAYKQFADGKSETKYSMWATILGNIINVIINYFLIFGIWIISQNGNCRSGNWNDCISNCDVSFYALCHGEKT